MYRLPSGNAPALPDAEAFLQILNALPQHAQADARELFDFQKPLTIARAPGRLDLMGGIADYSGSLVLQWPIKEATFAAVQPSSDRTLKIVSLGGEKNHRAASFAMPLSDFEAGGTAADYTTAREYFRKAYDKSWAAYVAGNVLVLLREKGVKLSHGLHILIHSEVPEGKGVSSSAAIEVATMQALSKVLDVKLDARELAILCQMTENRVVGAPCGVMDQMTSSCGKAGELLALLCQPAEIQGFVKVPSELAIWGIDSGVKHAVTGADYGSVRVGAFMGYRIIGAEAGLSFAKGQPFKVHDPKWKGYLANLTPSEFEMRFASKLPEKVLGEEFLQKYDGTTDAVTRVDYQRKYSVLTPTAHPIYEHFRVRTFAGLLAGALAERDRETLGELMYQSHASYSRCGLGSDGTDLLVQLVREAGVTQGLYGAKITGGGSGGTVAVLGRAGSDAVIATIAEKYAAKTNRKPYIFSGTSPGAGAVGALALEVQ
jgi:L-arabinokinase